ncbi:MAG: malate dehydrogenase [Spirochaetota bacterium]|nr:malate dehydrogenase [Spirochaetota bacterium]
MKKKITVVGSGHVGATCALYLAQKELGDVTLVDIIDGVPQGIGLDIFEASPIQNFDCNFVGTTDSSNMAGSDIVIVTAGLARKPGMDRMDLMKKNASIIKGITENIVKYAPNAMILMVSNPIDVMVYLSYKVSGFPKNRVFGQAGVLDSARLAAFVAKELNISVKDVSPMVLGGHGDTMIPLPRYTTVSGIPITELISEERINDINVRTQKGGAEIVNLLKTGSAYYAPGAAAAAMVESILKGQNRILPTSCLLEGEYGINDVFIGVPTILGENGVEKIIELKLNQSELKLLQSNAEIYKKNINELRQEEGFGYL